MSQGGYTWPTAYYKAKITLVSNGTTTIFRDDQTWSTVPPSWGGGVHGAGTLTCVVEARLRSDMLFGRGRVVKLQGSAAAGYAGTANDGFRTGSPTVGTTQYLVKNDSAWVEEGGAYYLNLGTFTQTANVWPAGFAAVGFSAT